MPRGLIVVLAVTGLLVSVLALREFTAILGPVLLALILAMGVHPLTGILHRRGAPMWLAVTVTLVTLVTVSNRRGGMLPSPRPDESPCASKPAV